jgi:hypothetical protein
MHLPQQSEILIKLDVSYMAQYNFTGAGNDEEVMLGF